MYFRARQKDEKTEKGIIVFHREAASRREWKKVTRKRKNREETVSAYFVVDVVICSFVCSVCGFVVVVILCDCGRVRLVETLLIL